MPSVRELSDLYASFMLAPVRGPGVCDICLTFTDAFPRCYPCASRPPWLDAVTPISYSVAHEQLHHTLAGYKRLSGDVAQRFQIGLAAVLWRFLDAHEPCLAKEAGVRGFDTVTTVPSGLAERDTEHPLTRIVGELCGPTRQRFARLLQRTDA